jgi:CBS domain-containing protein
MESTPDDSTLQFLRKYAPFDQMDAIHLDYLVKRLGISFFSSGEVIAGPEDGAAETLYIVKQGRVVGSSGENDANAWELLPGEAFPIGALLAHRPVRLVNRAAADTFCYTLPRHEFQYLVQQSTPFHDFATRRLANLLDSALRQTQAYSVERIAQQGASDAPLGELIKRAPQSCLPTTPLREALTTLSRLRIGSMLITDEAGALCGIFTLHDLLDRVTLPEVSLDTPIAAVMTPNPVTLPQSATAHEAALLMARHGFGHICVTHAGRLVGVISERDLFALQRVGLATLSRAIGHAASVDRLAAMANDIHRLVDQMLAQGSSVAQLTQIITSLNDRVAQRVIELVVERQSVPPPPFTWLAFGSEGRGEQTLKTDQDNGILFDAAAAEAEAIRRQLLPLAREINEGLARCGFPLCSGNIMASNPECCLSSEEWYARFARWIDQGTPDHLLKASIFFDFRVIAGEGGAADRLRRRLLSQTEKNSRFRRQMAANALRNAPPLGMFGDFRLIRGGEHSHTLDLKLNGITPFVDAARILALAHGVAATHTLERLDGVALAGGLSEADGAAWGEAYNYIQLLRMRHHREQAQAGHALDNHIDPDKINDLDRRILKEAFRQARKLQNKLKLEYQL